MSRPLCRTCQHAMGMRGRSLSDMRVFCDALYPSRELHFEAYECSKYRRRGRPDLVFMERIAWTIERDNRERFVGFVPPMEKDSEENERRK